MTSTSRLIVTGLVFDILGAILLAKSFMEKNTYKIIRETGFGAWKYRNPHLLFSIIQQKVEAWSGASYLSIGFIFQILGTIQTITVLNSVLMFAIIIAGIIGMIILWVWGFKYISKKYFKKLAIYHYFRSSPNELDPLDRHVNIFDSLGEVLDCHRKPDEKDEDYTKRLKDVCLS